MWNRQELKFRGKKAFKANYWKCVLVGLILMVLSGGVGVISFKFGQDAGTTAYDSIDAALSDVLVPAFSNIPLAIGFSLFSLAVTILLLNPALVGCSNFFINNRKDPTTNLSPLGLAFSDHYGNIVKTIFMQDLFILLWSLLFVIPGIIKSYQYRLVPFILAENPDMDYHEVLERSKQLMYGSKWRSFILDLSFIGWGILGGLTLGVLVIFFVTPYVYATETELYMALAHPDQAQKVGLAVPDAETVEFEVTENK